MVSETVVGTQSNVVSREAVSESDVLKTGQSNQAPRSVVSETVVETQSNVVPREAVSESDVLGTGQSYSMPGPSTSVLGNFESQNQSPEHPVLTQPQVTTQPSSERALRFAAGQNEGLQQRGVSENMQNESAVLPQSETVGDAQNNQTSPLSSSLHVSRRIMPSEMQNGRDQNPVVLPHTPIETLGAQVSQMRVTPEETSMERPVVSDQSADVDLLEVSHAHKENRTTDAAQTPRVAFSQQSETATYQVASEKTGWQQPLVAQPQQPVIQSANLTAQAQAPVMDDASQRSMEELDQDVETFSESLENSTFVSSDSQTNDGAGREQRNAPHQTFVAPGGTSNHTASVAFGSMVEPEMALPNIEQNVDLELQNIESMPEHPEMRMDMVQREGTGTEVARGQLDAMPSEQIDRNYGVGEQVVRNARVMMRAGDTEVTMRLDPQELGEVTIRLSSHNQKVSGEIVVENQKVQEIVQRHLGTLREALASQGIQIENIDVSVNDRGAQSNRESFREGLEERSQNREQREQSRSDSRWEQAEKRQRQTSDGQVDFMA